MDKDLLERIGKTLHALNEMTDLINEYLNDLRRRTEREILELEYRTRIAQERANAAAASAEIKQIAGYRVPRAGASSWPPTTTEDTRDPYLSGRQPRRDGDSYGSVQGASGGNTGFYDNLGGPSGEKSESLRKR